MRIRFFGENAFARRGEIEDAVRENRPYAGLYLITLSSNPNEQLDLIPYSCFRYDLLHVEKDDIIGAAMGRDEAFGMVRDLVYDCFTSGGGGDLRAYLSSDRVL